jgi:hypothetical protein
MKRRMVAGIAALLVGAGIGLAPPVQAGAPTSAVAARTASQTAADQVLATRLVNRFFTILHDQDQAALVTFLSPAFQLERPDGSGVNKAQYLASPAKVDAYEISGLVATRAGDVVVARYMVTASETINGQVFTKDPAPRLSVFTKNASSGKWQLAAHANFNGIAPPAQAPAD